MIEQQITLCSNGRAVLSGYSGGLLLGYAHNTGVYRLRVVCSGEWDGTTVAAFWHLPGPAGPLMGVSGWLGGSGWLGVGGTSGRLLPLQGAASAL